jgi:hypothetical protein
LGLIVSRIYNFQSCSVENRGELVVIREDKLTQVETVGNGPRESTARDELDV